MTPPPDGKGEQGVHDRYVLFDEIASGGMATVHLGRLVGPAGVGFTRTVAIKKLHPHIAKDPDFAAMFIDEARLSARIRHPNVVSTLDVVARGSELLLVMEYVHGESLARVLRTLRASGERVPPAIAVAILVGVLSGLHAAHTATKADGQRLEIVHRDVSPQNIMVGIDGAARIADFGIAKAVGRVQTTREGQIKGKCSYMAPEQLRGLPVDARTDVFAASIVLWEALVGARLFGGDSAEQILMRILELEVEPPSRLALGIPPALDAIVLKGLSRRPDDRFPSARAMALALETALAPATAREVGEWVEKAAPAVIRERTRLIAEIEGVASDMLLRRAASSPSPPDGEKRPEAEREAVTNLTTTASTLTAVPATPPARRRPSPRMILAVLIGASAVATAASWGRLSTREQAAGGRELAENPAAALDPSVSVSATPSTAPADPSSSVSAPTAAPVPSRAALPTSRRTAPSPAPKPSAVPGCEVPYRLDSAGIRIVKPECVP